MLHKTIAAVLAVVVLLLVASPAYAEDGAAGPKSGGSQTGLLDERYNPIPDHDTEVTLNIGVLMGNYIKTDMDFGVRGGVAVSFPIAQDLGVYGYAGGNVGTQDARENLGVTIGSGVYGAYGLDAGVMIDWFHPSGSINLYQARAFVQSAFSTTDRLGLRFAVPFSGDIYVKGPYLIEWKFELAGYIGMYWQHSWYDELSSELGLYYVGGDVDSGMISANLIYYYNETIDFRFSSMSDFRGDQADFGLFLDVKIGPGATRMTTFNRYRFSNGGAASHYNCILNIPYHPLAPVWDPDLYWD